MSDRYSTSELRSDLTEEDYRHHFMNAARVIGREVILAMSPRQIELLNGGLYRILDWRGSVEAVTDLELIGAYEMVVDHVLPRGLEETFQASSAAEQHEA